MEISNLRKDNLRHIEQIEQFLFACFQKYSPDWLPTIEACREEILETLEDGKSSCVALNHRGDAVGWIGAIHDDDVWEIHPIAVSKQAQRSGVGRLLVEHMCEMAKCHGATAIWAGTSDEVGATSFSKIDLYTDLVGGLTNISAPDDHAIQFWLKMGFSIIGVQPDGEGLGKPSIHFAKRL